MVTGYTISNEPFNQSIINIINSVPGHTWTPVAPKGPERTPIRLINDIINKYNDIAIIVYSQDPRGPQDLKAPELMINKKPISGTIYAIIVVEKNLNYYTVSVNSKTWFSGSLVTDIKSIVIVQTKKGIYVDAHNVQDPSGAIEPRTGAVGNPSRPSGSTGIYDQVFKVLEKNGIRYADIKGVLSRCYDGIIDNKIAVLAHFYILIDKYGPIGVGRNELKNEVKEWVKNMYVTADFVKECKEYITRLLGVSKSVNINDYKKNDLNTYIEFLKKDFYKGSYTKTTVTVGPTGPDDSGCQTCKTIPCSCIIKNKEHFKDTVNTGVLENQKTMDMSYIFGAYGLTPAQKNEVNEVWKLFRNSTKNFKHHLIYFVYLIHIVTGISLQYLIQNYNVFTSDLNIFRIYDSVTNNVNKVNKEIINKFDSFFASLAGPSGAAGPSGRWSSMIKRHEYNKYIKINFNGLKSLLKIDKLMDDNKQSLLAKLNKRFTELNYNNQAIGPAGIDKYVFMNKNNKFVVNNNIYKEIKEHIEGIIKDGKYSNISLVVEKIYGVIQFKKNDIRDSVKMYYFN
jgi:hypothetical protein